MRPRCTVLFTNVFIVRSHRANYAKYFFLHNTAETYFLVKMVSNTRKMLFPHSKQIQFLGRNCHSVGGKCTVYRPIINVQFV